MKINYIDIVIGNMAFKTFDLKLPKTRENLEKVLIDNEISEEIEVELFDNPLNSVKEIEIKNFKIKETTENPTNVFYLNVYLQILKTNKLDVPEKEIEIDTIVLKEMISDLLNADNKDIDIEEIYKKINGSEDQEEKEEETIEKMKNKKV